jgi:hypothetical protein
VIEVMRRRSQRGLQDMIAAALVVAMAGTGCAKGNDCRASLSIVRDLDDKDLDKPASKPSDVAPIASYFEDLQTRLRTVHAALHDDSVSAWATNLDGLLDRRIQLLRSATFAAPEAPAVVPSPSASAGMTRDQALQRAAEMGMQQMVGGGGLRNSNEVALEENRLALHQAHEAYFKVCP